MRLRHPDPAGHVLAVAIAAAICLLVLLTPPANAAAAGSPFAAGSRHTGSVELVTGLRRNGRTTVRRARLSIPFYVCA